MDEVSEYSCDVVSCVSSIVDSCGSEVTRDPDESFVRFWVGGQVMKVSAALLLCSASRRLPSDTSTVSSSSSSAKMTFSYKREIRRLAASKTEASSICVVDVNVFHLKSPSSDGRLEGDGAPRKTR